MRGRSSSWTRIRLNLRHVPEAERPPQEALEMDYDPWTQGEGRGARLSGAAAAQGPAGPPR